MLECRAYHRVQALHVGHRDALAVRRVGDDDTLVGRSLGPLRQWLGLEGDVFHDSGALGVAGGDVDSHGRDVGADDGELRHALPAVVVIKALEELGVEVGPLLEGKALAVDTGVDVGGNHGGLDDEGARAAHGVEEDLLAAVTAHQDYAGGEDLVDGSLGLRHAVAAAVEALARRIEAQRHLVARDMHIYKHVRAVEAHTGALAVEMVAEPVGDSVLDAVGDEARVGERVAVYDGVDGEGLVERQQRAPVEQLHAVV